MVSPNGMLAYKNFKSSFKKPSLMFQEKKEGGKIILIINLLPRLKEKKTTNTKQI